MAQNILVNKFRKQKIKSEINNKVFLLEIDANFKNKHYAYCRYKKWHEEIFKQNLI